MLIMFISGLISFLLQRFPSYIIVLISGLIGYIYSIVVNAEALAFLIVMINVIFSLVPILLVKYTIYLRTKAVEMYNLEDS